jgi:hypothetical protein
VARLSGGHAFESKVIQSFKTFGDFLNNKWSPFFLAGTDHRYSSRIKQQQDVGYSTATDSANIAVRLGSAAVVSTEAGPIEIIANRPVP